MGLEDKSMKKGYYCVIDLLFTCDLIHPDIVFAVMYCTTLKCVSYCIKNGAFSLSHVKNRCNYRSSYKVIT